MIFYSIQKALLKRRAFLFIAVFGLKNKIS
jgi:hypothetical protein